VKYCFKVFAPWEGLARPGLERRLSEMRADLRACLNCRFYDVSRSNQCFANVEDPVYHKDRSNFCEEFPFAERQAPRTGLRGTGPIKQRNAFESLFKKDS